MESLVKHKRHIHFNAGETILKQYTSASHLVCIKKGLAKIIAEGNGNKRLILRLVPQNSIITGGGIFTDEVRHFSVQALTEVDCCFIESDLIIDLINRNSRFAFELLKLNNQQNMAMLNNLVSITQKYMPGRVADLLLHLKNDIYLSDSFETRLSRQELADMTSMTMESFIRILKEFKTAGIILTEGSIIHILDEDALKTISKKG
jgi:CRP/FNR family transcriptional regulator